jgi:hypothetical protein
LGGAVPQCDSEAIYVLNSCIVRNCQHPRRHCVSNTLVLRWGASRSAS